MGKQVILFTAHIIPHVLVFYAGVLASKCATALSPVDPGAYGALCHEMGPLQGAAVPDLRSGLKGAMAEVE